MTNIDMINALSVMNLYLVVLLVLIPLHVTIADGESSNLRCVASSCGDIHNISHPFRLKSDPKGCGDSKYELICEDNHTVLYFGENRYYVQSLISYCHNLACSSIILVDDGLQKDNCSSLPRHSPVRYELGDFFDDFSTSYVDVYKTVVIVNCSKPVNSPTYIITGPCNEGLYSSNKSSSWNLYALVNPKVSDVRDFCTISRWTWTSSYIDEQVNSSSYSYKRIHNMMTDGFRLQLQRPYDKRTFFCHIDNYLYRLLRLYRRFRDELCEFEYYEGYVQDDIILWMAWNFIELLVQFCAVKFVIGTPFVVIFFIYKYRRRHLAMDRDIEKFLQAHNNFMPIRYSYSYIKKITKRFKHKLGEGGYGFVYKGMLRSGNEVAIKILKHSKANGQDFISEVATIGRIHHVNMAQLIGFCFEGSKQALVYDFMSNGSLDKHIFTKEDYKLDYWKIYEIALGIARGIEYLHRGCDMQILHFDIKPHNILLDKNFTPKIFDFGLAKLYPTDHSIVSLTAARGTLGYMAPELFYKNIGGVSYKADVYSFGMLLMEMAGRRRNVNVNVEHSSQLYFPLWVYDQVNEGRSVEIEEVVEEERKMIKKMILVALWCIQLNPEHRPPMSKVLEMLEGDIANIQIPPKPLLYPSDELVNNDKVEMELETFSTSSSTPILSANFSSGDINGV